MFRLRSPMWCFRRSRRIETRGKEDSLMTDKGLKKTLLSTALIGVLLAGGGMVLKMVLMVL